MLLFLHGHMTNNKTSAWTSHFDSYNITNVVLMILKSLPRHPIIQMTGKNKLHSALSMTKATFHLLLLRRLTAKQQEICLIFFVTENPLQAAVVLAEINDEYRR